MAKKSKDQFDIFREATLGSSTSLSSLNSETHRPEPARIETPSPLPSPAVEQKPVSSEPVSARPEKVSKNASRELVSFHISKETKKKLNYLKVETDKSLGDLYNEAIEDLLIKYHVR